MTKKIWIISPLTEHAQYANKRLAETLESLGYAFDFIKTTDLYPSENTQKVVVGNKLTNLPTHILVRAGTSSITPTALAALLQAEKAGVKVMNTTETYRRAGDKMSTYLELQDTSIRQAKTLLMSSSLSTQEVEVLIKQLQLPIIIKATTGARGETVHKCDTKTELITLLTSLKNSPLRWIAQEFIASSAGKDIRVYIVGKKAVSAITRQAKSGFIANISLGGRAEAFPISAKLRQQAEYIAQKLNMDMGGLDFFFAESKDTYIFNEANLAGQFTGMEQAHNIDIALLLIETLME